MKPNKLNPRWLHAAGLSMACGAMLCLPQASQADNYTNNFSIGAGLDWNGNYWFLDTTGAGPSGPPMAGSTYELVYNGKNINNGGNTLTRNPAVNGIHTFPGDSLLMDLNTELQAKNNDATLDFPGVGGNPGLILNGGLINIGDDGDFPITGIIKVESQSFLSPGNNGANRRSMDIRGQLIGSGDLVLMQSSLNQPQMISGVGNTFSGQWFIKSGWLVGTTPGSLGTGNITVDPQYALPAALGYGTNALVGPALLDMNYNLNSPGTLILTNGGQFSLHQNCCFVAVIINGTALAAGTHTYTDLAAAYPANIVGGGPGTITVQPFGTPPVIAPNPPVGTQGLNWISTDVGNPTLKGSATVNADASVTIVGGGDDIWNQANNAHYYYAWGQGSTWDAIVEVDSFTGPDYWSKCELMVCASDPTTGPQGRDAFIAMMANQNTFINTAGAAGGGARNAGGIDQFRTVAGGSADWKQVGNDPFPIYPGTWLRISRNGPVFSLYYARQNSEPTSAAWVHYTDIDTSATSFVGQDNGTHFGTPFPDVVSVGVMVTAHNDAANPGGVATISHLSATFPATHPPSALGVTQPIQSGVTNILGGEASLSFASTNNAVPQYVPVAYQWYKNGSIISNATASVHTWLLDASDNGALYSCQASIPASYGVTPLNSANAKIGVLPGIYYTNGLKREFWANTTSRTAVEDGNVGPATSMNVRPNFDDPGGYGNNYIQRVSGYFIPPASANYVFFIASDDDADLFLSTDSTAPHKALVAQETGWSGFDQWIVGGGGGSNWAQKRSDTFSPDGGVTTPWAAGIPLTQGQPYYIESVMHQGGGGDDFSVTYQTVAQVTDPNWSTNFNNGTHSLMQATNHNIALITKAPTTLTWVLQPSNTVATLGLAGTFSAKAVSDSEFVPNYQWYRANAAVPGATGSTFTIPTVAAADSGILIFVVATTAENELSITSSVATLSVALPVLERGWAKQEYWMSPNPGLGPFYKSVTNGVTGAINNVYLNTYSTPANYTIFEPLFEGNSKQQAPGVDFTSRLTANFYPPVTGDYVFFVNSDDGSDLFVSTDSSPTNAVMVAQETGWSGSWTWVGVGGGGTAATKRSDQWVAPDGTTPWALGIHMIAGQPYFVVQVHANGAAGGNNNEASFKLISDPDPVNGTYSKMTGNVIGTYVPRCFSMAFAQEPANLSVPFGGAATLTALGATDSKNAIGDETDPEYQWTNNFIFYQWTRNGVPIAGANGSSYTFGPVSPLDSSAQFACQIRALGYVDSSLNVAWSNSTPATVTVSGGPVFETGFALHSYWHMNPSRAQIENDTAGNPDWLMVSPAFTVGDTGVEIADNFSDALNAICMPQTTGDYVFFCNGDDDTDLFLSTDDSVINKRLIAQETGAAGGALQWSTGNATQHRSDTFVDSATGTTPYASGIHLVAGQKYFMQLAHHQGGGNTYSCVTAKLIGGADPANGSVSTIRGSEIGCYVPRCTYVNITNQPQSITVANYASASFTAGGATDSTVPVGPEGDWRNSFNNFLIFQWSKNGTAVPGATASTLTLPMVLPGDNGSLITCQMRALGFANRIGTALWANSQPAVLTVVTSAPPQLLYSGFYTNYGTTGNQGIPGVLNVTLHFSGPMDPVALSNPANYTLGGGLSIVPGGITVSSNGYRNVTLAVTGTPTFPLQVTVNNTRALGGGPFLSDNTTAVNRVLLSSADVGIGNDPAVPSGVYPTASNAFTVQCEGSDIWNNNDGFNFLFELKHGDFDVVVRQLDITKVSNWTKGGLMIRETLDPYSRNWNIVNDPVNADGLQALDGSGTGANVVECNARVSYSLGSGGWGNGTTETPAYPNAWVRLTRQTVVSSTTTNSIITGYCSTNGINWVLLGQTDTSTNGDMTPLPDAVYVGICSTAHDNDGAANPPGYYLNTADYANYVSSYVVPIQPKLTIVKTDSAHMTVSWTPTGGRLLASPALGASANWQPLGTANPTVITIGGTAQYFRVATP
jgi:PA14 domain